jgi:hypothetical protein
MKVESPQDGPLALSETLSLLRWGALLGGVLMAAALVVAQKPPSHLDARTFLAGNLVALLAFAIAGFIPDREFEFHSESGELRWRVWRLAYTRAGLLPFREISAVLLKTEIDAESRSRRMSFRLVLVTSIGHLPLTSVRTWDRAACEKLADDIRGRLGLRMGNAPSQTIEDLASGGHVIDAITLARRELKLDLAEAREYVESLRERREERRAA